MNAVLQTPSKSSNTVSSIVFPLPDTVSETLRVYLKEAPLTGCWQYILALPHLIDHTVHKAEGLHCCEPPCCKVILSAPCPKPFPGPWGFIPVLFIWQHKGEQKWPNDLKSPSTLCLLLSILPEALAQALISFKMQHTSYLIGYQCSRES